MIRDIGGKFIVVHVDEKSKLVEECIDVISRGQCGSTKTAPDPLLDWVYQGTRGKNTFGPLEKAPSSERLAWFRWLTTFVLYAGLSRGGVYALVDKASRKVAAAAITCPPRCTPLNKDEEE